MEKGIVIQADGDLLNLVNKGAAVKKLMDAYQKKYENFRTELAAIVTPQMDEALIASAWILTPDLEIKTTLPSSNKIEKDDAKKLKQTNPDAYQLLIKEEIRHKVVAAAFKQFVMENPWILTFIKSTSGKLQVDFKALTPEGAMILTCSDI